jgi:4-carboxymuconolactone decarboxylase
MLSCHAAKRNRAPLPSSRESVMTTSRIKPLEPPYAPEIAAALAKMMPPGSPVEPLRLFRTLAHNFMIGDRFRVLGSGILNKGSIDALDREIVILRTTARCGSEYEWGVHVVAYGRPLGLSEDQIVATANGASDDPAFTARQGLLVQLADALHEEAAVSDDLWRDLEKAWTAAQLIELLVTAGFYHIVSFVTNAARVEREDWAERFPARPTITPPRHRAAPGHIP